MNWATPFMTVPNLTRLMEDRAVFPVAISGDELIELAEAAERLAARARKEILDRWVECQWAPERAAK
jgi:hypothetical protein